MSALTQQQSMLLRFIKDFIKDNDYSPSFQEMAAHMGVNPQGGIHRLVCALEERHFITRIPHRKRAIEVISKAGLAKYSTMDLRRELMRRQTGVAPAADQHA